MKENLNLILLLAANCRSHILEHVKHNLNTKPNIIINRESKSSKKIKTSGNHYASKEGDVKVEVESSDDDGNANEHANHQLKEGDIDTEDMMNPLDVIVQRSNEMEEQQHRLDYLKMGQHFLDLQGIYDSRLIYRIRIKLVLRKLSIKGNVPVRKNIFNVGVVIRL